MDTVLEAKKDRFNERKIIGKICSSIYYHMATIVTIVMRKGQIFKRSLASV